jgi:hypothetical protein
LMYWHIKYNRYDNKNQISDSFGIGFANKLSMKNILLILCLSIFIATPVFAQVYKWVDEKGSVHYTDDVTKIPEKYRPRTEQIQIPEEKSGARMEGAPSSGKKEEAYRDRLGRGEEYWKGRVDEWKKKLRTAEEKMEQSKMKYNEFTERFNDSRSSLERNNIRIERDQIKSEMDQHRNQIEEAKMMLEKKIPEEAGLYKAKPEWIIY